MSAPSEILSTALEGTLIDAGERVATGCGDWHGDGNPGAVRHTVAQLLALDRLQQGIPT